MGTYFYWVNDEHKVYVCLERYNDMNYDSDLIDKFFDGVGEYNTEFEERDNAMSERKIQDMTIKDLTYVLDSAKRYYDIISSNEKHFLVYLLDKFLGVGRVMSEYEEEFKKIEKEYKDLTKKEE